MQLPFSMDCEAALLCEMLHDKEARSQALQYPTFMFYHPPHRVIFNTIADFEAAGVTPDLSKMLAYLYRRGQLDEAGGEQGLQNLWSFVPTSVKWPFHLDVVTDRYYRRVAIEASRELESCMFDLEADRREALGLHTYALLQLQPSEKALALRPQAA